MVQDLKLSHTVNVNKVLLISVLTRWMGFKAFGNCHRYHQHEGGGAGEGYGGVRLFEELRYKLESCGFDSRWCHWWLWGRISL